MAIKKAKNGPLKIPTKKCFAATTRESLSAKSSGEIERSTFATIIPPKSAIISATNMSIGMAIISAMIRGSTKNAKGSKPIVRMASSSCVIFIEPICAANAEPLRPAMTMAVITGASSRNIEMPSISTM